MTTLYVLTGKDERYTFELKKDEISIGQSPDNDIQLKDQYVSRNHLMLRRDRSNYYIRDLKSKNGTFVNGKEIEADLRHEIREGFIIVMGMSVICLGEGSSDDVFAFLDSMDHPKGLADKESLLLKERMMTRGNNMELIKKVSEVLMKSSNVHEISSKILKYIFDLFTRIDRGTIILLEGESEKIFKGLSRFRKDIPKGDINYSQRVVNLVLKDGEPFMALDTHNVGSDDILASLNAMDIKSALCVPLISQSEIIGVIYVDSMRKPFGFRKEDLSLFTSLSGRAAFALEMIAERTKEDS